MGALCSSHLHKRNCGSVRGFAQVRASCGVTDVSDVVIQFPVQHGEEAQLFGVYLAEFMDGLLREVDRWVDGDAPFVMVRSDPLQDVEVKVLTFQHHSAAQAFSSGWARARTRLSLV